MAVFKAFDRPRKGKGKENYRVTQMPSFIDANSLQQYIIKVFEDGTAFSVKYISNGKILNGNKAEILPWAKRFPDEFYIQMFLLRGWTYKGKGKSPYVGKVINWMVYNRLRKGVIEELKRLNPILNEETGYRRYNLHQRLSKEHGVRHLDTHISILVPMMRGCDTWEEFERIFRKSFNVPLELTIDNPEVLLLEENDNN